MEGTCTQHSLWYQNYLFFKENLEKENIDPQIIYTGISKLDIVEISLDKDRDNPQLIFESMNSTGLDLTQTDLIRNYIFMGLTEDEQQDLYKSYWSLMEQSFNYLLTNLSLIEIRRLYRISYLGAVADPIDYFLRDYLTIKSRNTPSLNKVYASFKNYRQHNSVIPINEIVADIFRYANYYVSISLAKDEDDQIRQVLQDIKSVESSIAHPLILEIYDDFSQQLLSREEFIKILKFFESYFLRRIICRSSPAPSSWVFRLFIEKPIDKSHYLESISNTIIQAENEFAHTPSDDEFKAAFVTIDIYNNPKRNYILNKLENYKRKEFVNIQSYTIEHIMPQTIKNSEEWKIELGENWKKIHPRLLHTIGNLTLTGYNPELSNRPFREKRDMEGGFADSPIRLNRSLAKLEHWNEEEIQKRAQTLADLALQIWSLSNLSSQKEKNKSAKDKVYTIKDYPQLKDEVLTLFEQLRKRIMNLDITVKEELKEYYIVYKTTTTFAHIEPDDKHLRIILDIPVGK